MIYLTPRRPIKTAAQDCEIRGGEYTAYDRSDYATALKVWLPLAQEGDKVAQTYVGEIYEKGLGVQPDYALAAVWYQKAAAQDYTRAQINLGYLYEKGLGVKKDPVMALNWYRRASGLSEAITIDPATLNDQVREELEGLRQEVEQRKRESEFFRRQLEQTQQQLRQTQQELEKRNNALETERYQLEQARQDFAKRKQAVEGQSNAELKRLEEQLQQREAELERQRQEMNRLSQEIARLEAEAKRQREQLAKLNEQQVVLAGPTIEIIDPPLMTRSGTPVVRTRSDIERVIVGKVSAPAGLLTFAVNGREEQLESNGLFRVLIPVLRSKVPVTVVAVDKQGKRATVEFLLTPEESLIEVKAPTPAPAVIPPKPPVLPPIDFGGFYAIVIGNKDYQYWPKLDTPINDATKTAELLREKYNFKTKVLLNATRYDILQSLNEMRKQLTEKDNLLIYYAGHGILEEQIGRGYWVPVDGEIDSNANWISTFAITDIISVMSAKHVLVVADSCYSGALTRSALARLEAGMSEEARAYWIKVLAEKRSRTVLSSGDLQPVLDSGGGGNSIFAKAFLDVLRENNEILEGQRLYREVSARVSYAASAVMTNQGAFEQIPQYAPIRYAGHEAGDFLFVPSLN
jgi:multidrug efflux pump subunit AcrA (membrane-fusion protein)